LLGGSLCFRHNFGSWSYVHSLTMDDHKLALIMFFDLPPICIFFLYALWSCKAFTQKNESVLSNFFKSNENPHDFSPLRSIINLNQSHCLKQVQVEARFNHILIWIVIILPCNLSILVDCPLLLLMCQMYQQSMLF